MKGVYILNESEIQILQKGAKFTPTPNRNKEELKSDVSEYCRKLRLKEYFHNKDNEDESIVRNKSSFCPEKDRNDTLDSCIDFLTWEM